MLKKWQLLTVCVGLLGVSWQVFADDNTKILPTDDKNGCTALIQKGDMDPPQPVPTQDIATIQSCMTSCNDLYQSLSKQKGLSEMLRGASYCRQSLKNLYYTSVAQTIYDQLDAQTQQENAAKKSKLGDRLKQLVQPKSAAPANNNTRNNAAANSAPSTTPDPADADHSGDDSPANNNAPKGPSEDINWF